MEVGLCEKVSIEFTGLEVDEIMRYQNILGVDTVQQAVMNAVRIAMDEESKKTKKGISLTPIIGLRSWYCRRCYSRINEGQKVCNSCGCGVRWS